MEKLYVFGDSIAKGVIYDEEKGRYVYIRTAFLQRRDYRDYLCIDGIHPNDKGHILIADILLDCRI